MHQNNLYKQDILSIKNLSKETIEFILATANKIKNKDYQPKISDKIIANCFFEPSTRTRLSFETAGYRLGAKVIGFSSEKGTSMEKGETLHDTIKVIDDYADLIVIRHAREGAARLAAEIATCPVINAGDGANQHPTQALIDLFTIKESQKRLDGLSIGLVGDLKYGRAIHSLIEACSLYDIRLYLVASESLSLPEFMCDKLKRQGIRFSFHQSIEEVIRNVDILYMTRIQQERFNEQADLMRNPFVLNTELLKKAKDNLKVLHPLPRVNEIASEVDETPFAYYFQQASNGVPVRQALLSLILQENLS